MYDKIPTGNMEREEWLKLRKTGIGGSDAGAVCGLNPYSSPMKLFYDKTSDETEEQENEAMRGVKQMGLKKHVKTGGGHDGQHEEKRGGFI